MAVLDFRINSKVRSVLARHWVDLTKVGFSSIRGTVRLTGTIARLSSETEIGTLDERDLAQLEGEIMHIREVKRVYFDLDNWRKDESRNWIATTPIKIGKHEEEGPAEEEEEET